MKIDRSFFFFSALFAQVCSIPIELALGESFNSGFFSTLDKISKGGFAAFFIISGAFYGGNKLLMGASRLKLSFSLFLMFLLYSIHIVTSGAGGDVGTAISESLRLATFTLILFGLGAMRISDDSLRNFIYLIVYLGFFTAVLSIINSYSGSAENQGRYVGDLVRAGSDLIDSNFLGGFLVICSIFSLALAASSDGFSSLIFMLLFFAISAARFWTFSTGSLVGEVVSLIAFGMMARKKIRIKVSSLPILMVLAVGLYYLISTDLLEKLLYRVFLSDGYVYQASVGSRIAQYIGVWSAFTSTPSLLITGVGTAHVWDITGTGFDIHNSLLRPLVVGGFGAFLCYLYIVVKVFQSTYRWTKARAGTKNFYLGAGILSAYLGWQVQTLTIPAESSTINFFMIMLLVGISPTVNKSKSGAAYMRVYKKRETECVKI